MGTKEYNKKNLMLKILKAEEERQAKIKRLTIELHELEDQGDMCDTDKIDEIIKELMILNPLPEKSEDEKIPQKGIKKKNSIFTVMKVSAVIIAVLISVQVVAEAKFNVDIFGGARYWTQAIYSSLIGTNARKNDAIVEVSNSRQYKTIEEFEKAENIDIIVPTYLPDGLKIVNVICLYNKNVEKINIIYDDGNTSLSIDLDLKRNKYNIDDAIEYKNEKAMFYIFTNVNVISWEYEDKSYILTCGFDTEKEYQEIIKNIK